VAASLQTAALQQSSPMAEEDATRQACIRSDALKLNLLVPTSMGQILNKSERIVNDMPWTSQGAIADKHGAKQIDVKPAC